VRAFFYDTWAFLALANTADDGHAIAVEADAHMERAGYAAVTSDYVVDETLTGLHAAAGAPVALAFADAIAARTAAGELTLTDVTAPRRERALTLFRRLAPDALRLSFTDCTSFALMHEFGITAAFTADPHFHRAGRGVCPLIIRRAGQHTFQPPG